MSTLPPQPPLSSAPSATNADQTSKRSGCGRGCLVGCVGLVVILVLAVIVGLVVARPMLEARWKEWQAKNPEAAKLVAGALPVIKEMAGGLATKEETADTAGGKPTPPKRLEGVNDKSAMPADLPVWPRAKSETYNVGQDHAAGFQRVKVQADSVLRFYRQAMPEKGWQLTTEQKGAGGVLLLYKKGPRVARVEVVGSDTGLTEIWLRSRVPEPPKKK
jgi:hypothetical protein